MSILPKIIKPVYALRSSLLHCHPGSVFTYLPEAFASVVYVIPVDYKKLLMKMDGWREKDIHEKIN